MAKNTKFTLKIHPYHYFYSVPKLSRQIFYSTTNIYDNLIPLKRRKPYPNFILKKIKFELLVIFHTVVSCGSISSASERLTLTQPALSIYLQKIEKQLGYSLFRQTNVTRNFKLTSSGLLLFNYSQRLFQIVNESIYLSSLMGSLQKNTQYLKNQPYHKLKIESIVASNLLKYSFPSILKIYNNRFCLYSFKSFLISIKKLLCFEVKLKFFFIKEKCLSSKQQSLILMINNQENFAQMIVDKQKPLKIMNYEFSSILESTNHIEIHTINAFKTCLHMNINTSIFWGTNI